MIPIIPDKRFKKGHVKKMANGIHGPQESLALKPMDVPANAPLHMRVNTPMIASPELATALKKELTK